MKECAARWPPQSRTGVRARTWRRALYAALLLLWLAVLTLPLLGVVLAVRGELEWDRGLTGDRFFIVQERRQRGIGWQATRRLPVSDPDTVYVRTVVRYWLWEGESEGVNVQYVECYAPRSGGGYEYIGPCTPP